MAASTIGWRKTVDNRARWSSSQMPTVKCSTFSTRNTTSAAGNTSGPNASNISGSPILPALLNISGGTKVFIWNGVKRTSGQASRPEPSTISVAATTSGV